jgi:hypothetical protein
MILDKTSLLLQRPSPGLPLPPFNPNEEYAVTVCIKAHLCKDDAQSYGVYLPDAS